MPLWNASRRRADWLPIANDILAAGGERFIWPVRTQGSVGRLYQRILFDDPQHMEALLGQSELLGRSKSWDAVVANCNFVIDRYPHHQRARFLHCTALSKLKRFEEMLESAKMMAISNARKSQGAGGSVRGLYRKWRQSCGIDVREATYRVGTGIADRASGRGIFVF